MTLALTEEQQLLERTVKAFTAEHSPIARFRRLRDSGDERGYSLPLLSKMAELGWTAIPFSEADGGMGMGFAEAVIVTEALGRVLAPEPLIPSLLCSCQALALGGTAEQKRTWLEPAIAGRSVLALAHAEAGSRFDLRRIRTRAVRGTSGYRLSGEKHQVWGGNKADAYVVSALLADESGLALFIVPATARGITVTRQNRIDQQNVALVRFEDVLVPAGDRIGDDGLALLERVVDRATVALCGEMLGGMTEAFERTLAYLKERRQFDAIIGTFQALKHRAARMYIELELSRSAVMAAARALDEERPDAAALSSLAKARLSDAYCLIANESVQLHGGIGMTDEHDIGFFLKRARACEMTFGDAAFHRDRYARLGGY